MQKELLDILACPRCHGDVTLKTEKGDNNVEDNVGLICAACAVMYPIRDDIPIMLLEEAISLAEKNNSPAQEKKENEASCASS